MYKNVFYPHEKQFNNFFDETFGCQYDNVIWLSILQPVLCSSLFLLISCEFFHFQITLIFDILDNLFYRPTLFFTSSLPSNSNDIISVCFKLFLISLSLLLFRQFQISILPPILLSTSSFQSSLEHPTFYFKLLTQNVKRLNSINLQHFPKRHLLIIN